MAGFSSISGEESIVFADNASFDGTERGGALNADGMMWIGSSTSPHVIAAVPGSGNNITPVVGHGSLAFDVTGTTNHAALIGNASGSISSLGVAATGTVFIGNTGADPSFSATPSVSSITIANAPVVGTDGVNKTYADSIAAGFTFKSAVQAASTGTLNAAYLNGAAGVGATLTNSGAQAAFAIDGYTASLNDRILVQDQSSNLFQNGIYTVTKLGTGATNWVLTRATDYDQTTEITAGSFVAVINGTINADTTWVQVDVVATIGVDPIQFNQFSSAPIMTTQYDVLIGGTNNSIVSVGPGSAGQIFQSGGNAANPAYSTATYPATATGTGTLLRADGTNWSATTSTYPNTNAINTLLYASSANVLSALATGNNGVLITSAGGVPSISSTLPSAVQGNITTVGTVTSGTWNGSTIDVPHGGTGQVTNTIHGVLLGQGTSAITATAAGNAGQILQSGGALADPAYSTATYPATATGTGTLLRADGTNWSATTSTYPNTNAINTLLYASSANVLSALATGNNGVLITSAGGVPSISSTLPSAVQGNITTVGTITSGTWNGSTIDVPHGGTGQVTNTIHGVLLGQGTSAITATAAGNAGQILQSGGALADPAYSTATYPATAIGTGTLLRADGTNWSATTSTYPNTNAINTLLYASSANVLSALATGNNGVLITSAGGVPSISSTLPSAVQGNITTVGTITSGTWNGSTIDVPHGGTGQVTNTIHGVLLGQGTSAITATAAGNAGQVLQSGGALADPAYSTATYPATATGTGTILRADGTNWSATTSTYPNTNAINTLLYASAANVISALATANDGLLVTSNTGVPSILAGPGSTGNVLQSNAAAAPSFSTATYPSTATGTGTLLRADGTNWSATTSTYPNTNAINTLLYASAANVMSALATADNGLLITSATGVPSILAGPGTSGNVLQSNSAGPPSFSTPTYPSASGGAGKILRSDGTNNLYTTATFPDTAGTTGNVLTSDGTNWTSSAAVGPNGLSYVMKNITSSQIKALHGTPIAVLAAPGLGKIIQVLGFIYSKYNYGGSNVFTAAAGQSISLYYGTTQLITQVIVNSGLTGNATSYGVFSNLGSGITLQPAASFENLALNLYNDSPTEITGNAGNNNTATVSIYYTIVTIT